MLLQKQWKVIIDIESCDLLTGVLQNIYMGVVCYSLLAAVLFFQITASKLW